MNSMNPAAPTSLSAPICSLSTLYESTYSTIDANHCVYKFFVRFSEEMKTPYQYTVQLTLMY